MSTNTIIKGSAVAAMTFAAMAVSASANAQSARYGNVFDYEQLELFLYILCTGHNACRLPSENNSSIRRHMHARLKLWCNDILFCANTSWYI